MSSSRMLLHFLIATRRSNAASEEASVRLARMLAGFTNRSKQAADVPQPSPSAHSHVPGTGEFGDHVK